MDNSERFRSEEDAGSSEAEAVLGSMPEFGARKVEAVKTLTERGFSEDDAFNLMQNRVLQEYRDEALVAKVNEVSDGLEEIGYSGEDVVKMAKQLPAIYSLSVDGIKQKFSDVEELGYSREDVIKMTKQLPTIYGLSIDNMKQKFTNLEELGYSRKDVIEMTKLLPAIYSYSIDNMKQKFSDLEELGYSKEDVVRMTKLLPSIYSRSIESMKQKISDLEELGYSRGDVIEMTRRLPAIYGYSVDNLKQKVEFYDSLGLHDLAVTDTKRLMQSVALSYSRNMFFEQEKQINIGMDNCGLLFMDQGKFKKRFGYTNEEIKQKYPYEEGN